MAKVQFQASRGKGFSNLDPGYMALSRMREKQQDDLANIKKEQKQARQRDLDAEAHLERVQKQEEANKKEIYIEGQTISTREKALRANRDIEIANNKANIAGIQAKGKEIEALWELAPKAFKDWQTIQNKNWDATSNDAYNYYMTHGMDIEDQIKLDLLEDKEWQRGELIEQRADGMVADGYTPSEVMWVRHQNSASDYGRLKAYSMLAGRDFGAWAKSKLIEAGITETSEQQAALETLQIEYLKAHNLYGISSDFLGPMFESISQDKGKIIAASQLREAVVASKKRNNEKLLVLEASIGKPDGPQALNEYHLQLTRSYDDKGNLLDPGSAKEKILSASESPFLDIEKFPDDGAILNLFGSTQFAGMNASWLQLHPDEIRLLIEARETKKETKAQKGEEINNRRLKKELDAAKDYLKPGGGWDGTPEDYDKVVKTLSSNGHTLKSINDEIGHFRSLSIDKQDGDFWTNHFTEKVDDHRIGVADLDNANIPDSFKTGETMEKARRNDEIFGAIDMEKRVIKPFRDELAYRLKIEDLDVGVSSTLTLALYDAETDFRAEMLEHGDFTRARDTVLDNIRKGNDKFKVKEYVNSGETNSEFEAYLPKNHKAYKFTTLNQAERDEVLIEVAKSENVSQLLKTKLFVSPKQLTEIAQAIKEGRPYNMPKVITQLSARGFGFAEEILSNQIEAAQNTKVDGKPVFSEKGKIQIEDFKTILVRDSKDPDAKQIIQELNTLADIRREIQKIYKPESIREPQFMDEVVAKEITTPAPPIEFIFNPADYPNADFGESINKTNNLIRVSDGVVNKNEVTINEGGLEATGQSKEWLKKNGNSNGVTYDPLSTSWYFYPLGEEE